MQGAVVSIINLQQNNANGLEGLFGSGQQGGQGSGTENSGDDSSLEASSEGSGVIYKVDGDKAYIVTNNHVVEGQDGLEVVLSDGTKVKAELVGTDAYTDLAVLRISSDKVDTVASFGDSDSLKLANQQLRLVLH